jgi:Ca2+-binding RTX toxin-like protein
MEITMPVFRTVIIDEDDRNGFIFGEGKRLILEEGVTLTDARIPLLRKGIALDASQGVADRSYLIKGDIDQPPADGTAIGMDISGARADVVVATTGSVHSEDIGIALDGDLATLAIAKGGVVQGAGTAIDLDLAADAELTVDGRLLSAQTALSMSAEGVTVIIGETGVVRGAIVAEGETRQVVANHGRIVGDIALGNGNDFYTGIGGRLEGQVAGGDGNDNYQIDDTGIAIVEAENEGTDVVFSQVTFTLGDNLEILALIGGKKISGFGNDLRNTIEGNSRGNRIEGGGDDDDLFGAGGADRLFGGDDDDDLEGGKAADRLDGGEGSDTASYGRSEAGVDVDLSIGEGKGGDAKGDTLVAVENLHGSRFDDRLTGDAGANTLFGFAGTDILTGGDGDDTFQLRNLGATWRVTDFVDGEDLIDVQSLGFDDFSDIAGLISEQGGNTRITIDRQDAGTSEVERNAVMVLKDIDASVLDGDDFIF